MKILPIVIHIIKIKRVVIILYCTINLKKKKYSFFIIIIIIMYQRL